VSLSAGKARTLELTDDGSVQSAFYYAFTRTALIVGTVVLREGRDLTGFQEPLCAGFPPVPRHAQNDVLHYVLGL
jgi:hypothetical protein